MRIYRLVLAALLAVSFTVLPVAAAMARMQMARMHMAPIEMSIGTSHHDCPCCNAAHRCAPDNCMFKCFNVSAIAVEASPIVAPLPAPFAAIGVTPLVAFLMRPDPPPPRS